MQTPDTPWWGRRTGHALRALLGSCLLLACGEPLAVLADHRVEYVRFDDLTPPYLTLRQSWNALGMDDRDRVYIIWTSTRDDGREDAALFRYTRATGEREFLGSFIDVATRQGNIRDGEQIPKGHTRIVQVGRKLYMGSQGFHDFKAEIDALPSYRGAHLFSYDLDTGAFDDVSRNLPGGVIIEHQGIISLAATRPSTGYSWASRIHWVIWCCSTSAHSRFRKVAPGIPWQRNHVVSREILVTRTGKVYTYRGSEDPEYRDLENEVWVYDIARDTFSATGQVLKGGFWSGKAETRDRSTVYMSTVSGELYAFDVARERFSHLGQFIDPARRERSAAIPRALSVRHRAGYSRALDHRRAHPDAHRGHDGRRRSDALDQLQHRGPNLQQAQRP